MSHTDIQSLITELHSSKKFLRGPNWEKRTQAAQQLGELKAVEAVDDLYTVIAEGKNDALCRAAIQSLENIGNKAAVQKLAMLLVKHARFQWHNDVIFSLRSIATLDAIEAMLDVVGKVEDKETEQAITRALVDVSGVEAAQSVISALGSGSITTRQVAAEVLNSAKFTPALIAALNHSQLLIQEQTVTVLTRIGEPAVDGLIDALIQNETGTPKITETLTKIGKPVVKPLIKVVLEYPNAMDALLQMKPVVQSVLEYAKPADLALVKTVFGFADQDLQAGAAQGLVNIGAPSVDFLLETLTEQDQWQAELAADALAQIGEPAAQPLIDALNNEDNAVRRQAVEILSKISGSAVEIIALIAPVLPEWQKLAEIPKAITVELNGNGDFASLAEAVAAASSNALIRLTAGSYELDSPLVIDKSLILLGADMEQSSIVYTGSEYVVQFSGGKKFAVRDITFIHQGEQEADTLRIEDGEILLQNCRFTGAVGEYNEDSQKERGAGIRLLGNAHGVITRCKAIQNSCGIVVAGQAQIYLYENLCQENKSAGIKYVGKSSGTARKNTCIGGSTGISVSGDLNMEDQKGPTLTENICKEAGDGIHYANVMNGGEVSNNTCSNNQVGIKLLGGNESLLVENNACNYNKEVGISCFMYTRGTLRKNRCQHNQYSGIWIGLLSQCIIIENVSSNNGSHGIRVGNAATPTLEKNTFQHNKGVGIFYIDADGVAKNNDCNKNGAGIVVTKDSSPLIQENSCDNNGQEGVEIRDQSSPTLKNNRCNNNQHGIIYLDNSYGTARMNTCSFNAKVGIFVRNQAKPDLFKNHCEGNHKVGIVYLDNSGGTASENICKGNGQFDIMVNNANPVLRDNIAANEITI